MLYYPHNNVGKGNLVFRYSIFIEALLYFLFILYIFELVVVRIIVCVNFKKSFFGSPLLVLPFNLIPEVLFMRCLLIKSRDLLIKKKGKPFRCDKIDFFIAKRTITMNL